MTGNQYWLTFNHLSVVCDYMPLKNAGSSRQFCFHEVAVCHKNKNGSWLPGEATWQKNEEWWEEEPSEKNTWRWAQVLSTHTSNTVYHCYFQHLETEEQFLLLLILSSSNEGLNSLIKRVQEKGEGPQLQSVWGVRQLLVLGWTENLFKLIQCS